MEGIYFYWISWLFWTYCTFLMPKSSKRTKAAMFILILLLCSNTFIQYGRYVLNLSFIILAAMCFFAFTRYPFRNMIYFVFASFIIMFSYVCLLLFSMYDPVWFYIDVKWVLSTFILLLSIIIVQTKKARLHVLLTGCCQGECLYRFLIQKLTKTTIFGSSAFFDTVSICCFLYGLVSLVYYFSQLFKEGIQLTWLHRKL
ncbi:hypothetical protein WD019_04945 [Fictibacillus sp. Mic-4]|uniref:YphA family membrane protein n=1 Tax=Fictibacillus TaxID=1329200 RepID=UPI000418BCA6|nr:hypothetical protein [Fictibacillus gelatini]